MQVMEILGKLGKGIRVTTIIGAGVSLLSIKDYHELSNLCIKQKQSFRGEGDVITKDDLIRFKELTKKHPLYCWFDKSFEFADLKDQCKQLL